MGDLIDMTEAAARIKREREGRMRRKADRLIDEFSPEVMIAAEKAASILTRSKDRTGCSGRNILGDDKEG